MKQNDKMGNLKKFLDRPTNQSMVDFETYNELHGKCAVCFVPVDDNTKCGMCKMNYCSEHIRKIRKMKNKEVRVCDNCEDKILFDHIMKSEMQAEQALATQEQIIKLKLQQTVETKSAKEAKFSEALQKNIELKQNLDSLKEQGSKRISDLTQVVNLIEKDISNIESSQSELYKKQNDLQTQEGSLLDDVKQQQSKLKQFDNMVDNTQEEFTTLKNKISELNLQLQEPRKELEIFRKQIQQKKKVQQQKIIEQLQRKRRQQEQQLEERRKQQQRSALQIKNQHMRQIEQIKRQYEQKLSEQRQVQRLLELKHQQKNKQQLQRKLEEDRQKQIQRKDLENKNEQNQLEQQQKLINKTTQEKEIQQIQENILGQDENPKMQDTKQQIEEHSPNVILLETQDKQLQTQYPSKQLNEISEVQVQQVADIKQTVASQSQAKNNKSIENINSSVASENNASIVSDHKTSVVSNNSASNKDYDKKYSKEQYQKFKRIDITHPAYSMAKFLEYHTQNYEVSLKLKDKKQYRQKFEVAKGLLRQKRRQETFQKKTMIEMVEEKDRLQQLMEKLSQQFQQQNQDQREFREMQEKHYPPSSQEDFNILLIQKKKIQKQILSLEKQAQVVSQAIKRKQSMLENEYIQWQVRQRNKIMNMSFVKQENKCLMF